MARQCNTVVFFCLAESIFGCLWLTFTVLAIASGILYAKGEIEEVAPMILGGLAIAIFLFHIFGISCNQSHPPTKLAFDAYFQGVTYVPQTATNAGGANVSTTGVVANPVVSTTTVTVTGGNSDDENDIANVV